MTLERSLKNIKDAKLDIELLRRDNEKKCIENNIKIDELQNVIKFNEEELESELKSSGEKKLECKLGWCSYRVMPDKWEYDNDKIIDWCKLNSYGYFHTIQIVDKLKLKKAIQSKTVTAPREGLTITPQDPKFNYKINGGI